MKRNCIKKSLLMMFAFSITVLFSGICVAETVETVKKISSEVEFSFIEPRVEHEKIETVLANGILNAKVYVDFGDTDSATAVLQYKLDSGEVVEVTKDNLINRRTFYIGTPEGEITKDNNVIDYRIKLIFEDAEEGEFVLYAPINTSSETFSQAAVVKKIEQSVNGSTGGSIEVFCGDQSKKENGTVKVIIPEGAYSGEHNVVVDFLLEDSSSGSLSPTQQDKVISCASVDVEGVSELESAIRIENLPLQNKTEASKFSLQYEQGTEWIPVSNANLSVNKSDQIYSFSVANLGTYRIMESISLSDSSYRPKNRIVVKGKVGNSYPGFEFKYLKEGDTITIYNLRGKKIRKINATNADVNVWDGKKDNGDWAESGTYIYQIKIKDKSDKVSGTVAFVW